MSFLGPLEEFLVELYPYRWPILIGALIVLVVAGTVGYLRGWYLVIWRYRLAVAVRRRKVIAAIVFTPVLGLFIFGGYFTLPPIFQRTYLEEASPLEGLLNLPGGDVADGDAAVITGTAVISADIPRITRSGEFKGTNDFHFGRGQAFLIETAPGRYTLRLEDFSVRNGPDFFVTSHPIQTGMLKATDGAFNYEIPSDTDVSQFKSAIIWCRLVGVLFAVAPLNEM